MCKDHSTDQNVWVAFHLFSGTASMRHILETDCFYFSLKFQETDFFLFEISQDPHPHCPSLPLGRPHPFQAATCPHCHLFFHSLHLQNLYW